MTRVFISYAQPDSEVALQLTTLLRGRGINVFFDYERMMNEGRYTRRVENEIKSRDYVLLIQSPEAMDSELVQMEIRYAQQKNVEIIPITVKPIAIRDTGEFAYLLHTRPIDYTRWRGNQSDIIPILEHRFANAPREDLITIETATSLVELTTLHQHTSWVRAVNFSPDGMLMASCSNDNTVCLWDTKPRDFITYPPRLLHTINAHDASIWSLSFSPNSQMLATCSNDNLVRIWGLQDLPDLYELTRFADHHEPVYALAFSQDGRLLASASNDKTVHLRDVSRMEFTGRADSMVPLLHGAQVYSVDFSPSSDMIATASRDSTISFWRIDPNTDIARQKWNRPELLTGHKSWVNHVAFSPIGLAMASASHDNTVRVWDLNSMETIAVLQGHKDSVNTVAFSPDGRLIVSTSKDNTVKVWDIATQREVGAIRGHQRWVNSAVFSPDGSLLVTASGDNTIKFWGVGEVVRS